MIQEMASSTRLGRKTEMLMLFPDAQTLRARTLFKVLKSLQNFRMVPGCDSFVNAVAVNECADYESILLDMEEVLKLQTADEDISMIPTLPVAICLLIRSEHRKWC